MSKRTTGAREQHADEPRPGERREPLPGGSGTAGPATPEKRQAGSYARDAEQDPERERHGRADADGPSDR